MSKLLQNPKFNEKRQILQNVNAWVAIHDLSCCCEHPLNCIIKQIYHQEPTLNINKEDFPKWFTTTETTDVHGGKDEEDYTGEDLDALFATIEGEDAKG